MGLGAKMPLTSMKPTEVGKSISISGDSLYGVLCMSIQFLSV